MSEAHWRLFTDSPASGAENMARDHALMERAVTTGEWMLRVYAWRTPTISLGRNQTARGLYDLERIHARCIDVVRRPTGGRAILHDREITYSVTAPTEAAGDLRASYERINRLLVNAMRGIGVDVRIAAPTSRATAPGIAPCFDEPAAGELTVNGRKLAGSAQWRAEGALLQHGSILIADDQSLLNDLTVSEQTRIPTPATLAGVLGHAPSFDDIAGALTASVRRLEDVNAEPFTADDGFRARTSALVVRYMDDAWTWRR
jgi:lipoyl(octanoyl) transferase